MRANLEDGIMVRGFRARTKQKQGSLCQAVSLEAVGCGLGKAIPLQRPGWCGMKTVITAHMGTVARIASRFPGPIFDLRPPDGDRMPQIVIGRYTLPLDQTGASSLRSILEAAERLGYPIYVVGDEEQWEQILSQASELTRAST